VAVRWRMLSAITVGVNRLVTPVQRAMGAVDTVGIERGLAVMRGLVCGHPRIDSQRTESVSAGQAVVAARAVPSDVVLGEFDALSLPYRWARISHSPHRQ